VSPHVSVSRSVNPFVSTSLALTLRRQLRFLSRLRKFKNTTTLGGVDKPALKVDAHGRQVVLFPHGFTSEKVQVAGCQDEDVVNTQAAESGAVLGCGVAVSSGIGEVRER